MAGGGSADKLVLASYGSDDVTSCLRIMLCLLALAGFIHPASAEGMRAGMTMPPVTCEMSPAIPAHHTMHMADCAAMPPAAQPCDGHDSHDCCAPGSIQLGLPADRALAPVPSVDLAVRFEPSPMPISIGQAESPPSPPPRMAA